MATILNLTKKAKEVYENNKAKGFWDGIKDPVERIPQSVALIHSEISEMLEAHRTGSVVKILDITKVSTDSDFKQWFKDNVKSTVEDEYADILIRALDLAGALNIPLEVNINIVSEYLSFHDFINYIHHLTDAIYNNQEDVSVPIQTLVRILFQSSSYLNIPLYTHMDMKLEYNKLRAYKHGKKY